MSSIGHWGDVVLRPTPAVVCSTASGIADASSPGFHTSTPPLFFHHPAFLRG